MSQKVNNFGYKNTTLILKLKFDQLFRHVIFRQCNLPTEGMLISVTHATLHEKARCFTCLKRSSNTCFP